MDCFEVRFPSKSDDRRTMTMTNLLWGFIVCLPKKKCGKKTLPLQLVGEKGNGREREEDGSEEDSDNL